MLNNRTGLISGNNALASMAVQENCYPIIIPAGQDLTAGHAKNREEKLTTILIIISIISLLLTF